MWTVKRGEEAERRGLSGMRLGRTEQSEVCPVYSFFWLHLGVTEDPLMAYRWTKYRVDAVIDRW